jgi:hypothetical protein
MPGNPIPFITARDIAQAEAKVLTKMLVKASSQGLGFFFQSAPFLQG